MMNELEEIKKKAFELMMNLHPQHIKVLNNEILRPLYQMIEQYENTQEARETMIDSLVQELVHKKNKNAQSSSDE